MIGKFIPIGIPDYRKEFYVKTMRSIGANGYEGLKEDGEAYHVYTKYWKFEAACDGKGLPSGGVECEGYFPIFGQNRFEWQKCLVLWRFEKECAVKSMHTSTLHYCDEFRPIRTEAERKRESIIHALDNILSQTLDQDASLPVEIYKAIAAGNIRGLKLEDS